MKKMTVISKKGIEYNVSERKAKTLVDNFGAKLKDEENKKTGVEVVAEIEAATEIEKLKEYESDTRQLVQNALKKRIKELS